MKTNRDEILNTAVRLFAERGYDAVSTGMIAAALGITKGALYRYFENKQQLFDSIIQKMFELDAQRANEDDVPAKTYEDDPEAYRNRKPAAFCDFVLNQFDFWTQEGFACSFRRMITLEQYKSKGSAKLYQDVIGIGPVLYSRDLLQQMIEEGRLNESAKEMGAMHLAIQLFAPLQLMIQLADGGADPAMLKDNLRVITEDFEKRWTTI